MFPQLFPYNSKVNDCLNCSLCSLPVAAQSPDLHVNNGGGTFGGDTAWSLTSLIPQLQFQALFLLFCRVFGILEVLEEYLYEPFTIEPE